MKTRNKTGKIPVLIYGNGLLNYSLDTSDGNDSIWNSDDNYYILIPTFNCNIDI